MSGGHKGHPRGAPGAASSGGSLCAMALIEHESEETLSREEAAARLRDLADQLARHNGYTFERDGVRTTVEVPDQVTLSVEVEVGAEGSEIEVEISW